MSEFEFPYHRIEAGLPSLDFNRQVIPPGSREELPRGGIALYVDDDFWCVALLPWKPYSDRTIQELVAEIWPHYAEQATFAPDHGTPEQLDHYERIEAENELLRAAEAEDEIARLRHEIARLKGGRTDVMPRSVTRTEVVASYFVQQYEHLLVAMAHEAVPEEARPGICAICGLYGFDRVHHSAWIERRKRGYAPDMPFVGSYGDDRSPERGVEDPS